MKKKKIEKKREGNKNKLVSPEIEKASEVAKYYGFVKLPETTIEKEDLTLAKKFTESHLKQLHPFTNKNQSFGGFLEEKISILRNFTEKKYAELPQPLSVCYDGPLEGNPHIKKDAENNSFNLEIIGSSKSISDAMVIETAFLILQDRYPDYELSIEINSIGDKDSIAKFTKELSNYLRKEGNNLNKSCKTLIKKDPYAFLECSHTNCKKVQEDAPKPMTFLSESSRIRFKEVLEYLESLSLPYSINHFLVGSKSYCSETIFEIKGIKKSEESLLAIGERYDGLSKKIWGKKEIPALGVSIAIHPHFIKNINKKEKSLSKTKFYFIQFGFGAKLKSLKLMELLRKSKINVEQSLSKDKLSVQIAYAEKSGIPYIIMMGQKEALEDSVVVRNMNTRCQETVSMKELISYLKKLK